SFQRGSWRDIDNQPVLPEPNQQPNAQELRNLLDPYEEELARWPLYISLDKDVMHAADAVVNWDSGNLRFADVQSVLTEFLLAAGGNLVGMDVVGDWSPVRVRGALRHFLHLTEHPPLSVDPGAAAALNEHVNLALLETVRACSLSAAA